MNSELSVLKDALEAAIRWLPVGGRIVVLSYHSIEDRVVKEVFADAAKGCICPPELPICACGRVPIVKQVLKKPLPPTAEEIERNPRARSAKLRAVERIN